MPHFYVMPRVGDGQSPATAFRPDVPTGVDWEGLDGPRGTFLVMSRQPISPLPAGAKEIVGETALRTACQNHDIPRERLAAWLQTRGFSG